MIPRKETSDGCVEGHGTQHPPLVEKLRSKLWMNRINWSFHAISPRLLVIRSRGICQWYEPSGASIQDARCRLHSCPDDCILNGLRVTALMERYLPWGLRWCLHGCHDNSVRYCWYHRHHEWGLSWLMLCQLDIRLGEVSLKSRPRKLISASPIRKRPGVKTGRS